jgi:hypothetical protein
MVFWASAKCLGSVLAGEEILVNELHEVEVDRSLTLRRLTNTEDPAKERPTKGQPFLRR